MSYAEWERAAQGYLEALGNEIGCDMCALGLIEDACRGLKWRLASGNTNERYLSITERAGSGLSGTVVKVGRAMTLQFVDLIAERRVHEYPIIISESLRSAYAVPIMNGRDVVGVLLIGDRRRRLYQSEERVAAEQTAARISRMLMDDVGHDAALSSDMVE